MYDFRDCYCFYWASNKPDLVDVVDAADGETLHRYVNFIRGDRSMPPARDVATWTNRDGAPTPLKHGVQGPPEPWQRRRDTELTYQDMVEGWWHRLPVVLDDREQPAPSRTPAPRPAPADLLTRNEAVAELRYLATVEHALVVEYLYAYYSLTGSRSTRAPFREPSGPIDIAANELFQIAIDEMRHLLWANELLRLLGEKEPSTGRAEIIGQEPIDGSGRKIYPGRQYHPRKFKLRRLSSLAFKLFIEVERASQSENAIQSASPGMYIEVLRSVTNPDRARFPDQGNVARLGPIVKLIIDEGVGHYHRFEAIQKALRGLKRRDYLRPFRGSADSTSGSLALVELCRHYYHSILEAIHIGFSMGEEVGGDIVRAAVRSMESFDDTARMLVERDIPPPFDHPGDLPRKAGSPDVAIRILDAREQRIGQALASASATGDAAVVRHARRHSELVGPHFARIRAGVRRRAGS